MPNFAKTNVAWEKVQKQFHSILFGLKIVALVFFSVPLIDYFMVKAGQKDEVYLSLIIFFVLLSVITLLWMLLDKKRNDSWVYTCSEIIIFFVLCYSSIWCSGAYASSYKFSFILMIVLFTIEYGMKTGVIISALSATALLATDLLLYHPDGAVNGYFESDLVLSAIFVIVAWVLGYYVRLANEQIFTLRADANTDSLTGAYNHRCFYEQVEALCADHAEQKQLSLIMLDIDNFKLYNDMFGHQMGDELLKEMSLLMKEKVGSSDMLCRYGGDEFAIVMTGRTLENTVAFADRIRAAVYAHSFAGCEHMPDGKISISLGVSAFGAKPSENGGRADDFNAFIKRADAALYRAKFMKRNRVEAYSSIFDELASGDSGKHMDERIQSLKTLISVINSRDSYTFLHVERVVYLSQEFAAYMKLGEADTKRLIYAAYLHDLGKINISKEILISDKKLTDEEFAALRKHPVDSADIISRIGGFDDVIPIVRAHHERWDGAGYPDHEKGEAIPFLARMLSLCDSFEAMTSHRPYQEAKSIPAALDEIRRCAGTQFDPQLAEHFVTMQSRKNA